MEFKYTYSGKLELYFETGMECQACGLHDDRGIHKSPSFNNETKKWDGPEQEYHSIEWLHFFASAKQNPQHLTVFNKDGMVIFEGMITRDRYKIAERKYAWDFLPKEVEEVTWLYWMHHELKAVVKTNHPVWAEDFEGQARRKKEQEEHQVRLAKMRAERENK